MTEETKFCCGDVYRSEAVRMLLGDTWHPGGLDLTGRLASQVQVCESDLVLDAACGVGTSSLFLSERFGCRVIGMDLSPANAGEARQRAAPENEAVFLTGDAHHIPLANRSLDAVVLECVLSTFSEKTAALQEIARVLKPGGRVGISDVIVEGEVPQELRSPHLQAFCVAGALSVNEYAELLKLTGFEVVLSEVEKKETLDFMDEIRRKLFIAQLLIGIGKLHVEQHDIDYARRIISLARSAVEEERLGYVLLVARKRE